MKRYLVIGLSLGFLTVSLGVYCAVHPLGDVNGDNIVNKNDALATLDYSVGKVSLTSPELKRADVTGNDKVTAYDASYIFRKSLRLIDKFPGEGKYLEDFIQEGKSLLSKFDFVAANTAFKTALELNDKNSEANFFYALTRIVTFLNPKESNTNGNFSSKELLGRLGIDIKTENSYSDWSVKVSQGSNNKISFPNNGYATADIQRYMSEELLPDVKEAGLNLDKINHSFNTTLDVGSFCHTGKVEIDYGDVYFLKSAYKLIEALILINTSYNLEMDNYVTNALISEKTLDFKKDIIDVYPYLLTLKNDYSMYQAKRAFLEAIDCYFKGSEFIRQETDTQDNDLISFVKLESPAKNKSVFEAESEFRKLLVQIRDSLISTPVGQFELEFSRLINLGALFDDPWQPRELLETTGTQKFLLKQLLSQIDYIIANLDTAGENFTQQLTPDKDFVETATTINYGDVLLFKTGLEMVKSLILVFNSYDMTAEAGKIYAKFINSNLDYQQDIISSNISLGRLKSQNYLALSKTSFEKAIDTYSQAVDYYKYKARLDNSSLISKLWGVNRYAEFMNKEENNIHSSLDAIKASLYGVNKIYDTYDQQELFTLNLSPFFYRGLSLRDFLPSIINNKIVDGTYPDPTFGGILPKFTQEDLN